MRIMEALAIIHTALAVALLLVSGRIIWLMSRQTAHGVRVAHWFLAVGAFWAVLYPLFHPEWNLGPNSMILVGAAILLLNNKRGGAAWSRRSSQ